MSRDGGAGDRLGLLPLVFAVTLSGVAALVYETIWTRSFAIILGSTVHAASATFAAFLVGLAGGAWIAGRWRVPLRFTIHTYAAAELLIGVLASFSGLLIHRNADAIADFIGAGFGPKVLFTFVAVLGLVLPSTLVMGATFPLMLLAAHRLGARLTAIGRFYALNTFGAALGTLVCGFALIRLLGVESSLWVAAGANVLAALACLPLLRLPLADRDAADASQTAPPAPERALSEPALLAVAAAGGLMVLSLEIAWTRLASYFLGNRTYAFTTLLACVLVLLAVGAWLSARLVDRFGRRPRELFGWTLVAACVSTALCSAGGWWWIQHQAGWEARLPAAGELLLLYRALETFVLLAPMLVALGCLFPMSLMCSALARRSTARAAGRFYLANTAGAVVGSLATGFAGVSLLGVFGCIAAVVLVGALASVAIFGAAYRREGGRAPLAGMASAVASLLLVSVALPARLSWIAPGEELAFRQEDEYGVLQVVRMPGGTSRVTNNRTELVFHLGLPVTSFVQEMQGHLGVFFQPDARDALVIGSGYGVTAGALTRYPQIHRIDAVEIIPGLLTAAPLFEPYNHGYQRDPRVTLIQDDGRHHLARSSRRYDIISLNLTDPHLPGASALFHRDFYEVVKRHLNEGGVVIQHAFGTDVDTVLRTLLASFRDVRMLRAYDGSYNVVAAEHVLAADPARADALLAVPSVRVALATIGMLPPITPGALVASAITREQISRRLPRGAVATDDHPVLEFAWSSTAARLLFSND